MEEKNKKKLESFDQDALEKLSKVINPHVVSEVLKEEERNLHDIKKVLKKINDPLLQGAEDFINSDSLDTYNPTNDPKYLRLLFAVFGLNDLQKIFADDDQKKELDLNGE
jgi:hypothetical protein